MIKFIKNKLGIKQVCHKCKGKGYTTVKIKPHDGRYPIIAKYPCDLCNKEKINNEK